MKTPRLPRTVLLILATAALPAVAADWSVSFGLHDFVVPDVDSDTFGINGRIAVNHVTSSGILLKGSFDVLVDNDKDDLDPDHIPVWFMSDGVAKGALFDLSPSARFSWIFDWNGKRNTVSSVERQFKLIPGIVADFGTGPFTAALKVGGGYYFLEIDDDAPRLRGYDRSGLKNDVFALTAMAEVGVALGKSARLTAAAQRWADSDGWLEDQFRAGLVCDTSNWKAGTELVFDVVWTKYNLDPYGMENPPPEVISPILAWDDDIFIRIHFMFPW